MRIIYKATAKSVKKFVPFVVKAEPIKVKITTHNKVGDTNGRYVNPT